MNKKTKKKCVIKYAKLFAAYEAIFLLHNRRLTVQCLSDLRHDARNNSKFIIIKNTLAKIVAAKYLSKVSYMFRDNIVIMGADDFVLASKSIVTFHKEYETMKVLSTLMYSNIYHEAEVLKFSKMSSRKELRIKLTKLIFMPIRLKAVLTTYANNLIRLISLNYQNKLK